MSMLNFRPLWTKDKIYDFVVYLFTINELKEWIEKKLLKIFLIFIS